MNLWLNIILIVGPLFLATYLATVKKITRRTKRVVWVICLIISISGVILLVKEKKEKEQEVVSVKYYHQLQERDELFNRGLLQSYIDGLGETPLLKHSFRIGQEYEKETKSQQAIEAYKKCLNPPNDTEANKVSANLRIGNCYYVLSRLKDAEKHYGEAFNMSGKVRDKAERLLGSSAALANIGLIYRDLGKRDEALRYHQDALKIHREIGHKQGEAADLGNIGLIYSAKGDLDNALKYHQDALKILEESRLVYGRDIITDAIERIEKRARK